MSSSETQPLLGNSSIEPKQDGGNTGFHGEDANPPGAIALFFLTISSLSSVYLIYSSGKFPCMTLHPFLFSAWGGFIGFLWEVRGGPLHWYPIVKAIRGANVGFVLGFQLYLVLATSMVWKEGSNGPYALLMRFGATFYAGWLFVYSLLGQEKWRVAAGIPTSIVGMVFVTSFFGDSDIMSSSAKAYFLAFLVTLLVAFLAGMAVPPQLFSPVYHGILVPSVIFGFLGVYKFNFGLDESNSGNVWETCHMFDSVSDFWGEIFNFLSDLVAVIGLIAGGISAIRTSKLTWYTFRYHASSPFWTVLHYLLLGTYGPMPPGAGSEDWKIVSHIPFAAYERNHPSASPLSVPSAMEIPVAQKFDYALLKTIFKVTDFGDRYFPAAVIDEIPSNKPRVDSRLGIDYYWSEYWLRFKAPETSSLMKQKFLTGEMLSYCLLYSHAYRSVREPTAEEASRVLNATGKIPNRVLDLQKYERYQPKEGYSPYGGKAYFIAKKSHSEPCGSDDEVKDLEVLGVVAPRDSSENVVPKAVGFVSDTVGEDLIMRPGHKHFNYIQKAIHATTIYEAVALHHLMEIHTVTSITSIALSNAFDRKPDAHGFRAVMQLHYYMSTLVQEVTTPHLMNRYSTFPQVFSLRAAQMSISVNDHFQNYEYLADCDFEKRRKLMKTPQMMFEMEYFKRFKAYGANCVRAIWGDQNDSPIITGELTESEIIALDQKIASDEKMAEFLDELIRQMPTNSIPYRFAPTVNGKQVWNALGVVQFIAETIHLHTVRHQYLGTKMALNSLDHRYSGLGSHCIDDLPIPEEEYFSLILIVAATALKPFPTLLDSHDSDTLTSVKKSFKDYLGECQTQNALENAFIELTIGEDGLEKLNEKWELEGEEVNEKFMRVLPKEVHIMAGY